MYCGRSFSPSFLYINKMLQLGSQGFSVETRKRRNRDFLSLQCVFSDRVLGVLLAKPFKMLYALMLMEAKQWKLVILYLIFLFFFPFSSNINNDNLHVYWVCFGCCINNKKSVEKLHLRKLHLYIHIYIYSYLFVC